MYKSKLLLPVLCCLALAAQSQTFYNNGATIIIEDGASVQVRGSLMNQGGTFQNNGTLSVTGNITCNATATGMGHSLVLNGTTPQVVSGTSPLLVSNFQVDNAKGVSLVAPLRIDGTAYFTNGVIDATDSRYPVVFTANAGVFGTPTHASHVNGYVVKEGTGSFIYPLGDAAHYQPVGVNLTANAAGLRAFYVPDDAGAAPFGTGGTDQQPLVLYNTNEYWDLIPAGSATGTVTVYYDSYRTSYLSSTNDLRVAHKAGSMWLNEGQSGGLTGNTVSGSVTSNTVSSWSPFTFGAVSQVLLPVTWLSFTGGLTPQKAASLQWRVQETGVQRYEVEKSSNARSFTTIGSLSGKGDGSNTYQFAENSPLTSAAFYRIRQTGINGQVTYSAIVKLSPANTDGLLTVYPNPVKDVAVVVVPAPLQGHRLKLADATGKILQTLMVTNSVFTLDMHLYPAGTYWLQADDGSTRKLIKQ